MSRIYTFVLLTLFACLSATGCAPRQDGTKISGSVTLDGTPLATGQIQFVDKQTNEPIVIVVKDGKYSVPLKPGTKKVMVTSEKVIGKVPRDPNEPNGVMIEQVEQIVPVQFNAKSTLEIIVSDKDETHNFNLQSSTK
ncbi:MAG: hypothetical protein LBU65_16055 [Planctomycetaceae bacterium]|jgi:hypothetical protein|nr:hypothetical protein [Planctomycetaceae bacterium]